MANLTRAERHNRMLSKTFENYSKHQNSLPSCQLYNRFLDMAEEKMGITRSEARSKYGQYTVKLLVTLLNLGWNKNNQTTN